jgi:hypothetical protein
MNAKLLLIIIAIAGSSLSVKAQNKDIPDYKLAGQLKNISQKIGLPVDSAAVFLGDFKKIPGTNSSEITYKSRLDDDVYIFFEKDAKGNIKVIKCSMPDAFLSTIKKAISMMGMIATGTEAPAGYTAYATSKCAAILNPQIKKGFLAFVISH